MNERSWLRCAAWVVAVAVVDYLASHFLTLPPLLERLVWFAVGPLVVVLAIALGGTMRARRRAVSLEIAPVLGVVGGATFTLMAVVQSAIHPILRQPLDAALDEATVRTVRTIWSAVDHVQLGMDVTYDVFGLTAFALFGWNMRHDARFGPILGGAGTVVSVACLALNLWSFPRPPTLELGPLVGVWGAAVAVALFRALAATPADAARGPVAGGERPAAGR